MSTEENFEVYQFELENEALLQQVHRSEAAARGKCLIPKWFLPLLVLFLILTILGQAFAMGYFISYPRISNKPLKLINEFCTVLSGECDSSRGLYCPFGQCICELTNSSYNGSSCACLYSTQYENQACVGYALYGQACNPPTISCASNYVCNLTNACACNLTAQYYNGSACVTKYSFNASCTQAIYCDSTLNLTCSSNYCVCASNYYWNGAKCVPKIVGWQTCNNATSGVGALPCDDTLGLSCYSNYTCQCPNTMYWDTTAQQCETKRLYGVACMANYYCNETLNFICPTVSGTCNCPNASISYTCDCQPDWFYDGLECLRRESINGTCPGTYACDRYTPLVCNTGLCLCVTPTSWSGSNCTCPPGQTYTGSACVPVG